MASALGFFLFLLLVSALVIIIDFITEVIADIVARNRK